MFPIISISKVRKIYLEYKTLSELCSRSVHWKIKSLHLVIVPNSLAISPGFEIWPRKQEECKCEKWFWENQVLWSSGKTAYWFPLIGSSSNGQNIWLFSRNDPSELWFRKQVCTVGITKLEHDYRKTDIHDPLLNLTWLKQDEKTSSHFLPSGDKPHLYILRTDLSCLMLSGCLSLCISVWKTTFPSNSNLLDFKGKSGWKVKISLSQKSI